MGIESIKLVGIRSGGFKRMRLTIPNGTITNYSSLQPLTLDTFGQYFLTCSENITMSVKMWGAGGGTSVSQLGGSGGYSSGTLIFLANQVYTLWVGQGGGGGGGATGTPTRTAFGGGGRGLWGNGNTSGGEGGGGGLSGIFLGSSATQGNAIIIAGGGGGGGHNVSGQYGGAGGGLIGQDGQFNTNSRAGKGGSQSSGGGTGSDTGGGLQSSMVGSALQGGSGYYDYNTGGGGGYFGGGVGSHDGARGGAGGGGGSGYINSSIVANGVTTTGNLNTPANSGDSQRNGAGSPGPTAWSSGSNGIIILTPTVL
jgi:hypothetical protein